MHPTVKPVALVADVGITPLRLLPSRPSRKRYQYLLSDVTLPRVRQ
jgi:hypothetical protein